MNIFDLNDTAVPVVCAIPELPLFTLKIFLSGYIFKTSKVSFPISTLLPTETFGGICDTYISVVAAPEDVISVVNPTFGISGTLILNESFNAVRCEVPNPDIKTLSPFKSV